MQFRNIVACMVVTLTLIGGQSQAKKPDNPGGGGGGKDGGTGTSYKIIELDNLNGLFNCHPYDINNAGLAVGSASDTTGEQGFAACWTIDNSGGEVTSTLQLLDGDAASGVNEFGEMVGHRLLASSDFLTEAVYWENAEASPIVLPTPEGYSRSYATGINNDGVVCGAADVLLGNGQFEAVSVVWRVHFQTIDGVPTPVVFGPVTLPQVDPDSAASGNAINDNDGDGVALVVGEAWNIGDNYDLRGAVAWNVMSLSDGSLLVSPAVEFLDSHARAHGVNNASEICGYRMPEGSGAQAVVWGTVSTQVLDQSATITAFGGKKSFDSAIPQDISDNGVVVGYGNASGYTKAVVWTSADAPMLVLDKFIKTAPFTELKHAHAVNELGEIVGYGWDNERQLHPGFLAIPQQ